MCGILVTAGLTGPFHHRLLSSLNNRGPDSIGFWSNGRVNLAHTRLAIIGLDERSGEPMENETHVLAYNGEIYNFLHIRERLLKAGVRMGAANDAEVLLNAWSLWGRDILTDLNGFWAFVIYDKVKNKLTLVRDQLGVKPLYYSVSKDGVCVSSMIRTILDVVGRQRDLDYTALSEYAQYQFTFGDKTFIKQIKKVMPGHIVEISLDTRESSSSCYEDILKPAEEFERLTPEWIRETRELIRESVLESTISDTSFSTFCSGGLDSSLITGITRPEIAYHCNFSDPECNETFFAQRVVEQMSTRLFVVNAQEDFNLVSRLDDIVKDFDELSIGSVILPMDDLLGQVKRRFRVILTGTGGDELFAGYVRYLLTLGECNQDNYRALFHKVQLLGDTAARFELCHKKGDTSVFRFYEPSVTETFKEAFNRCYTDGNVLRAMLRFDLRYFLVGLLNIDDKMSARHSVESRPSLLHQRIVRRMQKLESPAFLKKDDLKPLLKEISAGILPAAVIHRKDKMGFTTPIGTFVNKSAHKIREQIMNSRYLDHYNLKKVNFTAETKYSREVFGLLLLDLWLNRYAS